VKRAIELAEQAVAKGKTVSLGPLIHNQQVVNYLKEKGIEEVDSIKDVEEGQQLVIRSHGVPPDVYFEADNKNIRIIDATCPYVQKAQKLASKLSKNNFVIVVGDHNHPEVKGILGWAGENSKAIQDLSETKELPCFPGIAVLAQTTQRHETFSLIADELKKHTDNLIVHNTICSATEERQAASRELSKNVDVMVVVGGRNSSNTLKLGAICAEITRTCLIETADELQKIWFKDAKCVGLTAGASTPDFIIEEVYKKMSDILEDNNETQVEEKVAVKTESEETMDSFSNDLPKIYGGATVKGTVVKITGDEVFVDISWKSEGIIPIEELSATKVLDINDVVKVGDTISVMVTRVENKEGYTELSRKRIAEREAKEQIARLAETGEETQGKVTEVIKGGLLVDLGMRGFIPASQIETGFVDDLTKYVGKTLRLKVIEYDESRRKLVLSQKAILAAEQETKREKLLSDLKEGDVIKGVVRRLADFGAFIDLGGVDGLLHVSEMTFSRVNRPSDIVKIDDEVEVQVLKIDKSKGRISLGLKQLKTNPWSMVSEKYPTGSVVEGKVVRIAPFGAFVELEDGVDALIHISQLADHRVVKVEDVLKVGQSVTAKVIESKPEEKRISLSIREVLEDSQKAETEKAMASLPEESEVTIGEAIGDLKQGEQE